MKNIVKVWVDETSVFVKTKQGEVRHLPINSFRLLRNATFQQLQAFEFNKFGIHWPELDEDLSFEGFFTKP
jgi:hypothetical protein